MNTNYDIKWTTDTTSAIYKDALKIRYAVFVNEQGVSEEEEIDSLEEKTEHVVLYVDGKPVATARIYNLGENTFKVQRVAVLKDARGMGYGAVIMTEAEKRIHELGGHKVTLGAQNSAIPFYEKLAYSIEGEEFMDAGIPHHTMSKYV